MANLQISNYCDLFGFNSKKYPVSRLPLKIGSELYPDQFEFVPGTLYSGYDIERHIDDLVLIYFDRDDTLVLHMFVPEGTAKKNYTNNKVDSKLYRYNKYEHNLSAYENGQFQISSALEYMKKEYDEARKDNEHIHQTNISPDKVELSLNNGIKINPSGDISDSSVLISVDCYILCLSYDYDESLYDEFKDTDSCLIIHDVKAFKERIYNAMQSKLPDHIGMDARVCYSKQLSENGIFFSKKGRYIIQREYRFAWTPTKSSKLVKPLQLLKNDIFELKKMIPEPLKLSIGSLKDISELIKK